MPGNPIISYQYVVNPTTYNRSLKFIYCQDGGCVNQNNPITLEDATTLSTKNSIALGSDGFPVIAAYHLPSGTSFDAKVNFIHCTSPDCSTRDPNVALGGYVAASSNIEVAIGSDGFPAIIYSSSNANPQGRGLRYIHCNSLDCSSFNPPVLLDGTYTFTGNENSLAIGSDGLPVIVFQHAYDIYWNSTLDFIHCNNVNCSSTSPYKILDAGGNGTSEKWVPGKNPHISIGSDGFPIINYHSEHYINSNNRTNYLRTIHCNDILCNSVGQIIDLDSETGYLYERTSSMDIRPNGFPVISYALGNDSGVKYIHCNSIDCSSFNPPVIVTPLGNSVMQSSIKIGLDGKPLMTYMDYTLGNLMMVHCKNVFCSSTDAPVILDNSGSHWGYNSLAIS